MGVIVAIQDDVLVGTEAILKFGFLRENGQHAGIIYVCKGMVELEVKNPCIVPSRLQAG